MSETEDEKCLEISKKIVFDFDDVITRNINSKSKVLDIGFGTGKYLYRIYHNIGTPFLYGIEKSKQEVIEKSESLNMQQIINCKLRKELEDQYEGVSRFEFYTKYVKMELNKEPLSNKEFENIFNLKYDTDFDKKVLGKNKFNFILAQKVIHYFEVKTPKEFIEECLDLLVYGGGIYITFPIERGKRKINKKDFCNVISKINCLQLVRCDVIGEDNEPTLLFEGIKKV